MPCSSLSLRASCVANGKEKLLFGAYLMNTTGHKDVQPTSTPPLFLGEGTGVGAYEVKETARSIRPEDRGGARRARSRMPETARARRAGPDALRDDSWR